MREKIGIVSLEGNESDNKYRGFSPGFFSVCKRRLTGSRVLEYVNGFIQTGSLKFGFGGGWEEELGRGCGRVGEGVGVGLVKCWEGLGFLYFKNPV